jgi:hypothetical protein
MRAAIKTLVDVILVTFGVLLLLLVLAVVFYFRPTIETAGSGGIGAVSGSAPVLLILIGICVGIVGVVRLLYLAVRMLANAAGPSLQRSRTREHDQPRDH